MAKEAAEQEAKEQNEEVKQPEGQEKETSNTEAEQEVADKQDKVKTETELDQYKDKYLRLYSEFENFRRRTAKEKLEFQVTANEKLILDLLPVIDDFERAEKSMQETENIGGVKEGFDLIYQKMVKTLEQKGLKPINAVGTVFDPDLHEALTQIPAPDEDMKGKVIDEVEKGYYLGEKVIRFSKVVIGA